MFDTVLQFSSFPIDGVSPLNFQADESSLAGVLAQSGMKPPSLGGMADPLYQVLDTGIKVTDLGTVLPGESWEKFPNKPAIAVTSLNTPFGTDVERTSKDRGLTSSRPSPDVLLGTVGVATPILTSTDDFAGNTSTRGEVTVGGSRTGVVNFNGDRDWFRISLVAGRTYRFNLNGNTLSDPTLYLRNSSGIQLAYNDDSNGGRNSQITYRATSTGTYYLDAGAYATLTGSYTLLAVDTASTSTPVDDFAGNTTTRGAVTVGGSGAGVVNFNGDRDWFRISLVAGRTYRFNLNGNTLSDPTLYLRNSSGIQLAYNDDFNGGLNSQITYTATSTGTYYLDAGAFGSRTGSYALLVVDTTPVDDFAGNTSTKGAVTVGGSGAGVVNFNGDRDWFRISLIAGRTYRFNLNGNTLSDPTLHLRNSSGIQLADNDNSNGGRNSQITYTATSTGTYYLDAGAIGSLTGSYTLLAVDSTPNTSDRDRIPGLRDTTIRNLVNIALSDNLFTHSELTSLLRTVASSGVTATEFGDLRSIQVNLSSYLNPISRSYTQYIFNAVVNGNTANQWWTGGGANRVTLGNLAVGSTELHLNRLVDKWFGGLDLPTNFVGGDAAAGASSLTFGYAQMTGSLFVNGIHFSDVNQGQAGTCYFLAAASTLANNQSHFIQNMFIENGNRTYGVRFYGNSGNEIWVTVNSSVPVLWGGLALAGNSTRSLNGEMWVALAEKAYAQANEIGQFGRSTSNSYRYIEGGLEESLRHISNRPTTTFSSYYGNSGWTSANNNLTTWNSYLNGAINAVNAGRSLWFGSFGDTYNSSGKLNFVSGHAFAITGYNSSTQRFTIANPWGAGNSTYEGVFEATWSQMFNVRGVVSWA